MPMASTTEYLRRLRDLTHDYVHRCTPIELMGVLESMKFEIDKALDACNEEEDDEESTG